MSRVDLRHIAWEMCENETQETNNEMFRIAGDIEVVPRKMVEMIIEKCKEIQNDNYHIDEPLECGKWGASDEIIEYAESLLKQFEEDKDGVI